ncbi:MAG: hypothetical protein JW736_00945 [Deltaproteobacteria bacterium]|nr:hypothetical protein [Deltaproteobacteria bacterium]
MKRNKEPGNEVTQFRKAEEATKSRALLAGADHREAKVRSGTGDRRPETGDRRPEIEAKRRFRETE